MKFKKSNPTDNTVEAAIARNDYRIRHANQTYALKLVGKTVKFGLITVGVATLMDAAAKNRNKNQEEV